MSSWGDGGGRSSSPAGRIVLVTLLLAAVVLALSMLIPTLLGAATGAGPRPCNPYWHPGRCVPSVTVERAFLPAPRFEAVAR